MTPVSSLGSIRQWINTIMENKPCFKVGNNLLGRAASNCKFSRDHNWQECVLEVERVAPRTLLDQLPLFRHASPSATPWLLWEQSGLP
jgi:hypothetical protein